MKRTNLVYSWLVCLLSLLKVHAIPLMNPEKDESYLRGGTPSRGLKADGNLSIATLHGLGDSCFNSGMQSFTDIISSAAGAVFAECIPLGDTLEEDTISYFSLKMTEQVEQFAKRVQKIENFKNGFNIFGVSQGALVARGYIQRYSWRDDYPSVLSFISLHGPLMGVGKLPLCSPTDGTIGSFCNVLNTITGESAYGPIIQNTIGLANYYRHPCFIDDYLKTDYLPPMNGEVDDFGETRGLDILEELVAVKALKEDVVFPSESSWFGIYEDGVCDFRSVLTMQETSFFEEDGLGLKNLLESGRLHFEETPRAHVQVSVEEITQLVQKYW